MSSTESLLRTSLQCAVPLWQMELGKKREDLGDQGFWEYAKKKSKECSQLVAEKGDILLYRGGKKGESASVFNALAEGIALLSLCPGGVTVLGDRYEFKKESGQEESFPVLTREESQQLLKSLFGLPIYGKTLSQGGLRGSL